MNTAPTVERWHQITRFRVMVRPLKAVNKLHELMGRMLQRAPH